MNTKLSVKLLIAGCLLALANPTVEAQDVERLMSRLDQNGDGVLDQNEIPEQAKKRLMNRDQDGDGKVTRKEMLAGQAARPKAAPTGEAAKRKQPGKQQGQRKQEAKPQSGAKPKPNAKPQAGNKKRPGAAGQSRPNVSDRFQQLLKRVDKNGDGVLELSELPEQARQRLTRLDKDSDGKITADEMQAAAGRQADAGKAKNKTPNNNSDPSTARPNANPNPNGRARFQEMLSKLPKNENGQVDLTAIQEEGRRNRLSQFDSNDDQLLDRTEIRTATQQLQKSGRPGQPAAPGKKKDDRKAERGAERSPQLPKRPAAENDGD